MADVLLAAACVILAVTAIALIRMLRRRSVLEQMLAAQLLGTGGAAVVLLLSFALAVPAMLDVALLMVLLATISSTAFALGAPSADTPPASAEQGE